MQFYKFKYLTLFSLIFVSQFSQASFDLDTCLNSNSELTISHKVKPFGLLSRSLSIEKKSCIIDVSTVAYKFIKNAWQVDVCRSPIHIKKTGGGVEVMKKVGPCSTNPSSDFCSESKKLVQIIQDDGLIFAEGEKSNLSDDHGRVNCIFFLLDQYLNESRTFGEMTSFGEVQEKGSATSTPDKQNPRQSAPVPVYKDSANPDLETTPDEAHPEIKKEDSVESSTESNVSW